MAIIPTKKLDFWLKHGLNVLFRGRQGVGKTTLVLDTFNRHNLKWKYFSTPTMDPWVDFLGVPKEKKVDGKSYLDLILPKDFADDSVEALFFDEFNRGNTKVRNAVMELIQFKSINGRKFKNLKVVWAAINPYDEEGTFNVDQLDPAELDRFQVQVDMPYQVGEQYFKDKYGVLEGQAACQWWSELSDTLKNLISPRRLDYAMQIYFAGGDVSDVLPSHCGHTKLIGYVEVGSLAEQLDAIYKAKSTAKAKKLLMNPGVAKEVFQLLETKTSAQRKFFLPHMHPDVIEKEFLSAEPRPQKPGTTKKLPASRSRGITQNKKFILDQVYTDDTLAKVVGTSLATIKDSASISILAMLARKAETLSPTEKKAVVRGALLEPFKTKYTTTNGVLTNSEVALGIKQLKASLNDELLRLSKTPTRTTTSKWSPTKRRVSKTPLPKVGISSEFRRGVLRVLHPSGKGKDFLVRVLKDMPTFLTKKVARDLYFLYTMSAQMDTEASITLYHPNLLRFVYWLCGDIEEDFCPIENDPAMLDKLLNFVGLTQKEVPRNSWVPTFSLPVRDAYKRHKLKTKTS